MDEGVHSNKSGQADITLNATRNGNWAIYFMTYFMTSSSAISRGSMNGYWSSYKVSFRW